MGGQARDIEVACGFMRIADKDFGRPGGGRAFDGGDGLVGHQFAKQGIICTVFQGLVPMGDACDALDIDADIDFHVASVMREQKLTLHPLI